MCGILGWHGLATAEAPLAGFQLGLDRQTHRGPDARGVVHLTSDRTQILLGSNRLRISDLSLSADMPFTSRSGSTTVILNGEIYNFKSMRADLARRGVTFRTTGDTEVLAEAFDAHAGSVADFLCGIDGMFAFAIWDDNAKRLVLARDRLGIKPLYTTSSLDGSFAFASEAQTLVAAGFASGLGDTTALRTSLEWGHVLGPATAFQHVNQVEPGTVLVVDQSGLSSQAYWRPPLPGVSGSVPAALKAATRALRNSVQTHVVSDRQLGIFLSGGVDSGALAILSASANPIALTVAFPDLAGVDEVVPAASLAAKIGLRHSSVNVTAAEAAEAWRTSLAHQDQPSVDGLNSWLVSRAAVQAGITVALSGLGGDELFGGYGIEAKIRQLRRLRRLSSALPRWAGRQAVTYAAKQSLGGPVHKSITPGGGDLDALRRVRGVLPGVLTGRADELLTGVNWGLRNLSEMDLRWYMSERLLRDTDAMSMAHSLEVRVPLLDTALVDSVLSLPTSIRLGLGKVLLTEASGLSSPPSGKVGFVLPMEHWMRTSLAPEVKEGLLGETLPLADLVPMKVRAMLYEQFMNGKSHWTRAWSVVNLRHWAEQSGLRD